MLLKKNRGFTLIELLIVIAIIGILSSIVLADLKVARVRGGDGGIVSNLNNSRAQAELYNSKNSFSYNNVCSASSTGGIYLQVNSAAALSPDPTLSIDAAGALGSSTCNDSIVGWAAEIPLKAASSTTMFCVDYTGKATTTTATSLSSATDVTCL